MSIQDILTQVASKKISADEASKLISALNTGSARQAKLKVARNKSGGLYVIHPKVRGFSTLKSKEYTATVNFPMGVAESLFGDAGTLAEVAKAVADFLASESKAAA